MLFFYMLLVNRYSWLIIMPEGSFTGLDSTCQKCTMGFEIRWRAQYWGICSYLMNYMHCWWNMRRSIVRKRRFATAAHCLRCAIGAWINLLVWKTQHEYRGSCINSEWKPFIIVRKAFCKLRNKYIISLSL